MPSLSEGLVCEQTSGGEGDGRKALLATVLVVADADASKAHRERQLKCPSKGVAPEERTRADWLTLPALHAMCAVSACVSQPVVTALKSPPNTDDEK